MKNIWYRPFLLFFLFIGVPQFAGAGLIPYDQLGSLPTPEKEDVYSLEQMLVGEMKNAIRAYMNEDYRDAQFAIAKIKYFAKKHKLTIPAILPVMEKKIAEGRMAQLEEEITDQYHELNAEAIATLYDEAMYLAEKKKIPIPDSIHRIAAIMEQEVFDLVYHLKVYETNEVTLIEI